MVLSRQCYIVKKSRLACGKVACYTAAIRTGVREPNVVEKETQRADGDLRILLETLQGHGIDQRVHNLPDTPSGPGSKYLTTHRRKSFPVGRSNQSGAFRFGVVDRVKR